MTDELWLTEDGVFNFESLWVRSEQDTLIQDGETYAVDDATREERLGFW